MRVSFGLVILLLVLSWVVPFGNCLECHVLGNEKWVPHDALVEKNPHGDIRYYPFVLKTKRCMGSCDTLDSLMLRECWGNSTEKIFAKVYDIVQYKFVAFEMYRDLSCSCECRFSSKVCSKEQTWNEAKCRCEPFIIPERLMLEGKECTSTVIPEKPVNQKFLRKSMLECVVFQVEI